MNRSMNLLCLFVLTFLASCASNSFGHRDPNCNPDERLDQLLSQYEKCKAKGGCESSDGHILVDCDRVRYEIQTLALDFPRHVPILVANGRLSYEANQPEKAEKFVDAALGFQPIQPEAAMLKARISIEAGNLPFAKRLMAAQVQCTPDHPGLRELHSAVLFMSGDVPGAKTALDTALALGAPEWRVAYNRGLIAEAEGKKVDAAEQFEAAIAANPEFRPAHSRLAGMRAEGEYNKPPSPPGTVGGE